MGMKIDWEKIEFNFLVLVWGGWGGWYGGVGSAGLESLVPSHEKICFPHMVFCLRVLTGVGSSARDKGLFRRP